LVAEVVEARNLVVPVRLQPRALASILFLDSPVMQSSVERFERRSGVADQSEACQLVGIGISHVDVHETHPAGLESGLGCGCEIAVTRADAYAHVCLCRHPIGGKRAGGADRTHGAGMVERYR